MHPVFRRRWLFAIALTAAVFLVTTVPRMAAQGGEPDGGERCRQDEETLEQRRGTEVF